MSDTQVTIHRLGTVTRALAGREGDGLVVSFGDHKNTPLLWRSFKQLLAMKFPKPPGAPPQAGGSAAQPTANGSPAVAAPK